MSFVFLAHALVSFHACVRLVMLYVLLSRKHRALQLTTDFYGFSYISRAPASLFDHKLLDSTGGVRTVSTSYS